MNLLWWLSSSLASQLLRQSLLGFGKAWVWTREEAEWVGVLMPGSGSLVPKKKGNPVHTSLSTDEPWGQVAFVKIFRGQWGVAPGAARAQKDAAPGPRVSCGRRCTPQVT
jgi:hypothetical protein